MGGPGRALAVADNPDERCPDSAIDRLRGLLDVAAAVRTGDELRSVLDAVAAAIAGPLGYRAVVINLYRPAWDDFEVVVVFGNEESQELLMGQTSRHGGLVPAAQRRASSATAPTSSPPASTTGPGAACRSTRRSIEIVRRRPTPGIPTTR